MARLFGTGFEHGTLDVFETVSGSVGTSFQVSTVQARTGSHAMWVGDRNKYVRQSLVGNPAEVFGRVGFYWTGNGYMSNPRVFLGLQDSAGGYQITLQFNESTGVLEVRRGSYSGTLLASGSVAMTNTWHCYELHVLIDASNGVVQIKRDGVLDIDYAGNTQATANANVGFLSLGGFITNRIAYGYWDDIAINDTTGPYNNSWPGRGGFYAAVPSGAGEYTEFTPSSGNNYERVAVIPPDDDTGYVESGTAGHRDLYTTGGIAPTTGTISAVHWWSRARLTDAGEGNVKRLVRHDGTDYASGDKALDTSYKYVGDIMETAPDDTSWSVAKVNALQIGQQVG